MEHLIKYQEERRPSLFLSGGDMFINYNNQHTREVFRMLDFPEPVVKDIHEATREGVFQLIAFFSEQQEDRIMQALPECEATRWNPLFTDVVPVGGNKSIGMEKILAYFGISREETMAFGDGENIPMLEYAGIGVAMKCFRRSAAARRFRYIRCRRRRYCTCLETFSYRRTLKVWVNSDFTSIRPRSLSVMLRRYRFKRLQGFQKLSQTLVRFARCHCLKQFP
ncbi:MAG: HAD hydrolase family protein [Odoribacter splanchnicus]